jgi:galactokinase
MAPSWEGRVPAERCVAFAPGRVNLIGEHTDYNDGLSLPFAVSEGVTVTATRLAGGEIEAHATDLGEQDRFARSQPERAAGWRAFVRGAVAELAAGGHAVPAARLEITGSLPRGAGLSSSAALEVALCLALLGLGGEQEPDRLALARLCSRIEREWVGAQTGLLDQLASLFGEPGHALRIDFRSLDVAAVPLELAGWQLVTADSGQAHSIAESGYNTRRAECAEAARRLGIASLRDADAHAAAALPSPLDRRALHVIEENARVDATVQALRAGDQQAVGRLLDASHASLRDLYEVTTPAVERVVAALKAAGAAGARGIGGGFGGTILALLPPGVHAPEGARPVDAGDGARIRELDG